MRALAFLLTCALTCDGFTTYYAPTGQFAGSASTIGGYTFYRGPDGTFAGSAITTNEPQILPPARYENPFEESER